MIYKGPLSDSYGGRKLQSEDFQIFAFFTDLYLTGRTSLQRPFNGHFIYLEIVLVFFQLSYTNEVSQ